MIFLNVQIQKQIRREILRTLNTPVHMRLPIMNLIIRIRSKRDCLPVRRQGTAHHLDSGIDRVLEMELFGASLRCCWRRGSCPDLERRLVDWRGV